MNQIEKQFEGFITSMYGTKTISESQEKDIEKTFYAGMLVCMRIITALDDNETIALNQISQLEDEIMNKIETLITIKEI